MKYNRAEMLFHSITRLLSRNADANIRRLLSKAHPSEIAAVIRQLPEDEGVHVINQIRNTDREPETFVELEGKFIETYLDSTEDKEHIVEVMQTLPEDEVAALLAEVDEKLAGELLSLLQASIKKEVKEILQYGEDTCGRIMAVNVPHFNQNITAKQAIADIQNSKEHVESIYYIYVVDDEECLVGVISLRQLLQVKGNRTLKEFMSRDVVRMNVYETQEKAASYVEEYNFVSLPVVDDDNVLVGMVTVDDVIDYIRDEAQDDVLQMAGVESEAIDDFSFWRAFGSRAMWYAMLFLGGIFCSEIIQHYFSHFPVQIVYLCFAPLVLRLGGSISTQTHTFVTQGILELDIERSRAIKAFWGQIFITFFVAFLLSLAIFGYLHFRFAQDVMFSLGVSIGVLFVTVISLIIGLVIPVTAKKINLDPQLTSSRIVHFLMDAVSLLFYFKFLWIWQG